MVVYSYLKEQLINIPDSDVVKQLLCKKYKNLVRFVENFDKAYKDLSKSNLNVFNIEFTKTPEESQEMVKSLMQPTYHVSNDVQHGQFEDISEEAKNKQSTRKGATFIMVSAFILFLFKNNA